MYCYHILTDYFLAAVLFDDPAIYLADFGVDVVAGTTTGLGILDMPSEVVIDNQIITTDYSLICEASKFGDLLYGSQITVNGVLYEVRSTMMMTDGAFVQIALQRSVETHYATVVTSLDGNSAAAEIDEMIQDQLNPDLDGGSAVASYIDGNDLNGGGA